ncbi:MAG: F0F1 ATP synthase subunit delta [Candidatus Limnocylindrales bacterium]
MSRPVTAARRYAEAAFEVALADDTLDAWNEDLAYASSVLGLAEVERIVDSPALPLTERTGLAVRLLEGRLQPGAVRLVELLITRGRASTLPRVSSEFNRLLNTHRGIVMATVTSATPLTGDETAAIRTRVEAMAGARVDLQTAVDPALIGGVTVQIQDQLLDASVRGRLERLRDQLHAGGRPR